MARHVQITQNNEFTISLQYLKKEVSWFDFLHADKYGSFLQIDSVIFDADGQAFYCVRLKAVLVKILPTPRVCGMLLIWIKIEDRVAQRLGFLSCKNGYFMISL